MRRRAVLSSIGLIVSQEPIFDEIGNHATADAVKMEAVGGEQEAVAVGNFVPRESGGVKGDGVANIDEAVAVSEPGRKLGAITFMLAKIGDHPLMKRQAGDFFVAGDAADDFVVLEDLAVGFMVEIFADDGNGKQSKARAGFGLEPGDDGAKTFLVPRESRIDGEVIKGTVAEKIALAQGGVDIVGADKDGNGVGPLGNDVVEALQTVPGEIAINAAVDKVVFRQTGTGAEQFDVIEADPSGGEAGAEADDGFHDNGSRVNPRSRWGVSGARPRRFQ